MSAPKSTEIYIEHPDGARCRSQSIDRRIAALAAAQRGRVARRQLLAAGVGRRAIGVRLDAGRLHPMLPGVYAVGHPAGGDGERLMAAWLYGGEGAVLSHRGAGLSWGLGQFPTIDITVGRARRGVAGLSFHRAVVPAGEVVTRDGMRVTTPARTLLDLAAITPRPRMQRLYTEAEVLGLIDQTAVRRVLESHPGRRGVRLLGALAGLDLGERRGRIRSPLEARFRSLLERSQLPRPEYNARLDVGGCCYEIDVLWRRSRLAVELDGRHAHQTTERFDTDRGRDRRLLAHGWRPTRVTSAHLRRPQAVLAELQQLLADDPTTD